MLSGLKNDLEKQILSFDKWHQFTYLIVGKVESILVDYGAVGKLSVIDSLNKRLTYLMYAQKYPEVKTTFSELNSTGQFNLIRDKSLRSHIILYYQNSADSQQSVDGNTEDVIYRQLFPIIRSTIIIRPENFRLESKKIDLGDNLQATFRNNLEDSKKEFELINAISLRIIKAQSNKTHIEFSKREAQRLLIDINQKLNAK